MSNTSATGGVLPALPPLPLDDDALDAVFQQLIAAITGIDGTLVRPRWQPVMPKIPPAQTNWCALGVTDSNPDDGPSIVYDAVNNVATYTRHEDLWVLVSMYGPGAKANIALLRDGLTIAQNMEFLNQFSMRFVSLDHPHPAHELINKNWVRRVDMTVHFRRQITRQYGIQNIAVAEIDLIDDTTLKANIVVPTGAQLEP